MPEIIAWECSYTNTLFKCKRDYIIHLKRLAKQRHEERSQKKKFNKALELIQSARMSSLKNKLLQACELYSFNIDVSFSGMRVSDKVSNTHSAPRNGVTNLHSKSELPRGYPGVSGRIHLKNCDYDFLRLLSRLGVHIGTGGGGTYEVMLYEADFPHLLDEETIRNIIE